MAKTARLKLDEIGPWSLVKLEIIRKYARAYSTILATRQSRLKRIYIDGFCGSGIHITKDHRRIVAGSPKIAMEVDPPFQEYHFIDMDPKKIQYLSQTVDDRGNVRLYQGDCNVVLKHEVFPRIEYGNFSRALCLLDPYGLHLDWGIVETAGQKKVIEIFLNSPVADMNRTSRRATASGARS